MFSSHNEHNNIYVYNCTQDFQEIYLDVYK